MGSAVGQGYDGGMERTKALSECPSVRNDIHVWIVKSGTERSMRATERGGMNADDTVLSSKLLVFVSNRINAHARSC